jgi:hypothetical protein
VEEMFPSGIIVGEEAIARHDHDGTSFMNINTPDDFSRLPR